jgi:hypothetical protein
MNGESTGTGAANVAIMSNVAGFTPGNEIASVSSANTTGGFDTDSSGFGSSITLSGSNYANLSSIIFRIYGWNSTSGSGATYIRNLTGNDLVISGTVTAVPEPSTYAAILGGVALVGVMVTRRRKSAAYTA